MKLSCMYISQYASIDWTDDDGAGIGDATQQWFHMHTHRTQTHTHTNTLSHRKIIINSTGIPKASLNL